MFVSNAYAQTAAPAAPSSPLEAFFAGGLSFPVMMALMFGILYFMVIRPQNQERKKLQQAITKLRKGDTVLTTSGIIATVGRTQGEQIALYIDEKKETLVVFANSAIAQIIESAAAAEEAEKKGKGK